MNTTHAIILSALGLAMVATGCSDDTTSTDGGTAGNASTSSNASVGGSTSAMGGGGASSTSDTTSAGGSGGGGAPETGGGGQGAGGAEPVDPCATMTPVCPNNPPGTAGKGLVKIDRCAFPMQDDDKWADSQTLIDGFAPSAKKVTIDDVIASANRDATKVTSVPGSPANLKSAFKWQSGDEDVAYWIPQGISGSADGTATGKQGGKDVVLVSWYYDKDSDPGSAFEKGVRIAFADKTSTAAIQYRFALLVVPKAGTPSTFGPVTVHAGGIAWVGHYLYVVDTTKGFRVFDLDQIFEVSTDSDTIGYDAGTGHYNAHNYRYVIPQVSTYTQKSTCSPRFSWTSLDQSTNPPSLVAGEYCGPNYPCTGLEGRVFRFDLDPTSKKLAPGKSWPSEAFYEGQTQVQGGLSTNGKYFFSSSAPSGAAGALYVLPNGGASSTHAWIDSPEDLMFDPHTKQLYSTSEGTGKRYVISVDETKY